MFVQIHMLQSVPPGNLNRDDTGQPKKCLFGGVTRGRISSQCLKRNIRLSPNFKEAFGEHLAVRTKYLPALVADALKAMPGNELKNDEIEAVKAGIVALFKKEDKARGEEQDGAGDTEAGEPASGPDVTPQLVFFRPAFATKIAQLINDMKKENPAAYKVFTGPKRKKGDKPSKAEENTAKAGLDKFIKSAFEAKESLSVDVALFGRMTTSDLIADVEAACQVAHALSTHETLIESDYFTAMDDHPAHSGSSHLPGKGAAFLGSGDTETFFNSAVYYKYLNLDTDGLLGNLGDGDAAKVAKAASVLLESAVLATPKGKQNSFAAHSVPELVLVEVSARKQPISYANAFLRPVQSDDLMAASADALADYCGAIAAAYSPPDSRRFLLAVGRARDFRLPMESQRVETLAQLTAEIEKAVKAAHAGAK